MKDKGGFPGFLDDSLLSGIRDRFAWADTDPYGNSRAYLENAGGSLILKTVVDAVARLTAFPDNAGRDTPASKEIDQVQAQGLDDLRTLLGARSGVVFLSESTTSNAFRVLSAIVRNVPGKNVVTTYLDHPAVFDATKILAKRHGMEWRAADVRKDSATVGVEEVLRCVDRDTVVLTIIHSSNIVGTTNDVKTIAAEARKVNPDLYVLVDGAQHGPHGLVDVEDLGCDAYLISSYKTFGKRGASAAYLSDCAALLPHDRLLGKPETAWELGTREAAGYASWSKTVEYLCWLGSQFEKSKDRRKLIGAAFDAIKRQEAALARRVLKGNGTQRGLLELAGVTVYPQPHPPESPPVKVFTIEGMAPNEVVSALGRQGVSVHSRTLDAYSRHTLQALEIPECVRVSFAHYNTAAEVDSFLGAVACLGGRSR